MFGKSIIFFTSLALTAAIWIGPKYSAIYIIDFVLSAFNWFDGVHKFNTQEPNYVDGNWQPQHNELHKVTVSGIGQLPKGLHGGMYVRTGANPKCWPPANRFMNHAFNGEAMLHRYNNNMF